MCPADLFTHGDDDSLPANHGSQTQRQAYSHDDPVRHVFHCGLQMAIRTCWNMSGRCLSCPEFQCLLQLQHLGAIGPSLIRWYSLQRALAGEDSLNFGKEMPGADAWLLFIDPARGLWDATTSEITVQFLRSSRRLPN